MAAGSSLRLLQQRLEQANARVRELEAENRLYARKAIEQDRFFDLSLDILAIASIEDGRWKRVNPAFSRTLGWSEEEILTMPYFEIVHPDDLARAREAAAELSSGKPLEQFEHRVRCKNGDYRWIAWTTSPYPAEGLILFVGRDITERKAALENLRQSEERLRLAASATHLGAFSRNIKANEDYWSPEFLAIYGLGPTDPLPLADWIPALVHPEDRSRVLAETRTWLEQARDRDFTSEHRVVRPDGQVRWVEIRGRMEFDENGAPFKTYGFARDVTTSHQARQVMESQNALFAAITENIPVLLCVWDPELRTFRFNKHLREVLGWTEEDAVEDFMAKVYPDPEYRQQVIDYMLSLESGWRDLKTTAKDGEAIDISWANIRLESGTTIGIGVDIRQRKRAEESLRDSEERLKSAMAVARLGVWEYDARSDLSRYDERSLEILGVLKAVASSAETFAVIYPDDRDRIHAEVQAALDPTGTGVFDTEYRVCGADGSTRWVAVQGRVCWSEDCGPTRAARAAGTIMDITERKQSEEVLRQSRERLAAILEQLPVGVALIDDEGVLILSNACMRKYLPQLVLASREPEAIKRWHASDEDGRPIPPEQWPGARALRGEIVSPGIEFNYEDEAGEGHWILFSAVPFRWAENQVNGAIGVIQEITERKQAVQALRESEIFYRQTLESIPGMVFTTRPDGNWEFVSQQWVEYTGVPLREMLGEGWSRVLHPEDQSRAAGAWKAAVQNEARFDIEYRVRRADDEYEWFKGMGRPIRDSEEEIARWFGVTMNVTDLRRANEQLEVKVKERTAELRDLVSALKQEVQQRQEAEQQLRLQTDRLRALAGELTLTEQRERRRLGKILHDHLQQLLVGAKFRVAILGRTGDDLIREAASEIDRVLAESISVCRSLTAALSPPILQEGGLQAGLEWLVRWMRDKYALDVELVNRTGFPKLSHDVTALLFESLRELLFNTVKHAQVSSARITVAELKGGIFQIQVHDEGRGFDPDSITQLSEIGGGFGLFSIRERLSLIGGKMEIHAMPDEGTRILLTVPLSDGLLEQTPAPVRPTEAKAIELTLPFAPQPGAPIRVLVADDHAVVRDGLSQVLSQERDIEIIGHARDGQEAVGLARRLLPDLILMDVSMPRLNGVEATRLIHNEFPHIRIIGLSMFEETDRAQAMRDAGAVDYRTKSGATADLIAAIRLAVRTEEQKCLG
jgi:PAS domain S-box-containing protein